MKKKSVQKSRATPGPVPHRLKIEGDWESAAAKVVKVPRPPEGWPQPTPRKKAAKKAKRKAKKKARRSTP